MRAEIILLSLFLGAVILIPSAAAQDFGPNVRVDDGSYAGFRCFSDLTSTPEGELFCVWSDNSSGGADYVYVSKSTDGGMSWSLPFRLNDNLYSQASCPSITSDDLGNLYVVWLTGPDSTKIFFTCSRNGGDRWLMPNVRVDDGTVSTKGPPDIAVDLEGNLFVVWCDDRRGGCPDVFSSFSSNWGLGWSDPDLLVNDEAAVSFRAHPAISAWGEGQIGVLWADERETGDINVYFAHSGDSGKTFSAPNQRVNSGIPGDQMCPDIAWHDSTLWVTYSNKTSEVNGDIYFNRSGDMGHTWLQTEVMVNPSGDNDAASPRIAMVSGEDIGIVWTANLYDSSSYDLFFSRSGDNGDTWSGPSQVNDDGQGLFQHGAPALAFSSEVGACVSFFDYREGEPHIYFASQRAAGVSDDDSRNYLSPRQVSRIESFPNPFNSTTKIIYQLPNLRSSSKQSLKIYDLSGRLVRTLFDHRVSGKFGGESGEISWDGRDDGGEPVGSGLYFLKLECDKVAQTTTVALIK
jgi:hypothetical protein